MHGLGGFAESWRHNVAALADRATVYALDLPGYGRSAKPRTTYGLAYFARALHGFVETLGLSRVSLVGHSLGGALDAMRSVAMALASIPTITLGVRRVESLAADPQKQ